MEVSREDKLSKWKYIIKKLHTSKDPKLDDIKTMVDKGQSPHASDQTYLEEKYKQFEEFLKNNPQPPKHEPKQTVFENEITMIEKLHEKEIGDYTRLESIRNYLTAGQPLLNEDKQYLNEQYENLKKVSAIEQLNTQEKQKTRITPIEQQAILIDDVEEYPTHEFDSLSATISNIMRKSTPHFTIGIYGEWGTGKTTLMKSIEKNLKDNSSGQTFLPIWFNAWKYEREDNLASISLMKTVGYAMANHTVFDQLSKTIFKGLTIVGKDVMQQIALQAVSQKRELSDEQLDEKIDYLNTIYRDSVYYEGLEKIKEQMQSIRKEYGDHRVVIFIDDLDRCSPAKALEVLESIKLFLDLEGFVFVIGLSHKTVTQLITQAYKTTGIKGDDYIKKIIQIPIKIPSWNKESMINLINTTVAPRLNSDYAKFLLQNSAMIAKIVEYNPRQLKRFINNVIIAFETFAGKPGSPEISFNEIFLVKILKKEWPDFYREFVNNRDFREIVKWMLTKPKDLKKYFKYIQTFSEELPAEQRTKRILYLNKLSERTNGRIDTNQIDLLADFDNDTWIFLNNVKDVLEEIENWKVIDSVMDVVEEFSYDIPIGAKKSTPAQPPIPGNQVPPNQMPPNQTL